MKIKHLFIPHEENDYKPHLFREAGVAFLLAIILGVFALNIGGHLLLKYTNMEATVFPAVLADLANENRIQDNKQTLTINPILVQAAELKAQDMATKGYFAHTSPEGITPWHWFGEVNYEFIYAGENLAVDFSESTDVENAWMNSPGHRANILNDNFTEIGIATAAGTYQGRPTTFVVELFGKPLVMTKSVPVDTFLEQTGMKEKPAENTPEPKQSLVAIAPSVRGASAENVSIIDQTDNFISVKNETPIAEVGPTVVDTTTDAPNQQDKNPAPDETTYSTWYERILLSPSRTVSHIYLALLIFISLYLLIMIGIEVKRQHLKHITYAFLLLVIILLLLFIGTKFGNTAIII